MGTMKELTLVVGAGASNDFGLPTVDGLKQRIASALTFMPNLSGGLERGDHYIWEAMRRHSRESGQDMSMYWESSKLIVRGMPQADSIDNFIDNHRQNAELALCGKLAIVKTILEAERQSSLYDPITRGFTEKVRLDSGNQTWIDCLARVVARNCDKYQLEKRLGKICMIIFNYDRCVEKYLPVWLASQYDISFSEALRWVGLIEIHHPYGRVGDLGEAGSGGDFEFGDEVASDVELLAMAKNIKTFTEGIDPAVSEVERIRMAIAESTRLVFLGFAYHSQNLRLLSAGGEDGKGFHQRRWIFGTARGVSAFNQDLIRRELAHSAGIEPDNIYLREDLGCREMFSEFESGISVS
jgi:hypothetical protein